MKKLILLIGLMWCVKANAQSKQILLIGKDEADVLFEMKQDTTFLYDKQTFESDGNYHITYGARNKFGMCNFYFKNNICTLVVFYMPSYAMPDIISNLNQYYKRTDNVTWVEKTLHYKAVIHTEDNDIFELAYTKL